MSLSVVLAGLKVWEAPAREVWARMEGKSQRMLAAAAASPEKVRDSRRVMSETDPPPPVV